MTPLRSYILDDAATVEYQRLDLWARRSADPASPARGG
jgi:hypothetical protein